MTFQDYSLILALIEKLTFVEFLDAVNKINIVPEKNY